MTLELRLIRSFVCLSEELNFSRAAERLHIAQPALSRQIMALEATLGVQLLHRTKRKVELTAAGTAFRNRCCRLLLDVMEAEHEARRVAAGQEGALAISFINSSTYGMLPPILNAFRTRFPRVELKLFEMTISEQIQALRVGEVDIGLLRPPISDNALMSRPIGTQQFIVALPRSHPYAQVGRISLSALKNDPFVVFERQQSSLFYSRINAMCEAAGFVPMVSQKATQIHTVVGLVGAGMGVSIVPDVAKNLQLPTVSFAQIEDNPAGVDVCLAWRKDSTLPTLPAFAEIAATAGREYLAGS
ncbi:LysR family transcriptional regulator [Hoeflea sp. YIM 152468]|uniref:LysR family transcriptional regulator n=1 Tax=Hoeflea sp. YIM 152468 TaxID=3031759 RepID=UPI0023DA905C|nr:LysR family transcriptional regulator [Hoeflea sp. YIM 152468]MDF1610184.1 LysR family transcriptional regulator [Hoeflea sp. YIM 152468]